MSSSAAESENHPLRPKSLNNVSGLIALKNAVTVKGRKEGPDRVNVESDSFSRFYLRETPIVLSTNLVKRMNLESIFHSQWIGLILKINGECT